MAKKSRKTLSPNTDRWQWIAISAIIIALVLGALALVAYVRSVDIVTAPQRESELIAQSNLQATQIAEMQKAMSVTPTAATESATPIPQASPIPTITSTPVSVAPVNVTCDKHGTVAWQNDNQLDGQPYGEAPVGGLDEVCGVVGQTHWKEADSEGNMVEVRAVFYVQPHMVAWLSGHLGGTGWYFGGTRAEIEANLAEQAQQLLERDGKMKTYVIILPEDTDSFPILTRVQTKP